MAETLAGRSVRAVSTAHRRTAAPHGFPVAWGGGLCYAAGMTHTIQEKQRLLARVRRLRGQVEGIERSLEAEAGCAQVMHLIAGARGAMAGLMAEVVEDHVRSHLVDAAQHPGALDSVAAEQLLDVIRTYLK